MDNPKRKLIYPSPLAVCFHRWEDQCCPLLRFSCFVSIKWDHYLKKSCAWSDPGISSVLFGGTDSGTIVAYKICVHKNENSSSPSIKPICLLFGHNSRITSIIPCEPFIYPSCVASLSTNGTLSLISVEDLTIVLNCESLFSENSYDLAPHKDNSRLMLASQAYGTVEIADVTNSTLILRISGFSSIITSLENHNSFHSVSCADGTVGLFCINTNNQKPIECVYHLSNKLNNQKVNTNIHSIFSPSLVYMLSYTPDEWFLFDSDDILFSQKVASTDDSYTYAKWVTDDMFYVATLAGRVEIWKCDSTNPNFIFNRMKTSHFIYNVSSLSRSVTDPPIIIDNPSDTLKIHKPPQMIYSIDHSKDDTFDRATVVTSEGFIITSPRQSFIVLNSPQGDCDCDLSFYFSAAIRCRCALGDPILHEARITVKDEIYLDSEKLGVHLGANLLFSAPDGQIFFSFSNDGSVKAWNDKFIASFHDLCEPVKDVAYISEKEWLVVIGQYTAFSVISVPNLCSILLCSGHNSPVVEIRYLNGLLHSRCQSSSIYTWNIDGQLVSKRKSKKFKRIGLQSPGPFVNSQHQDQSNYEVSNNLKNETKPSFSTVVPLVMPNCQTFALVLDVFDFLMSYKNYESLDIQTNPTFLPLILLWRCHIGSSRVKLVTNMGLLESFTYAIAGDNYTVSLPFFLPNDEKSKRSSLAFEFSPLLSAIHSVAASAVAQCFVGVNNDENLSIVSSNSQTSTAMALSVSVLPSPLVIANYLMFPSSNLLYVVINVIQEVMATLSEEESSKIIALISKKFPGIWKVKLPFAFIHCNKYDLDPAFGRECVQNIFPVVIEIPDFLDLLLNCFERFEQYFGEFQQFFIELVNATISKQIPYNKIAGFGIIKPMDYFDVAVMTPFYPDFCEALFERWMSNDRDVLLNLISHMLAVSRKLISVDLDRIFEILREKISYFSCCKHYLVFGSDKGEIVAFSRETTLITWKQQITKHPISCLSVSPNGSKFVVVVLEEDKTITWVSQNTPRAKEPFSVDAIDMLPKDSIVSDFVWKSENKVILMNMEKSIMEVTAPNNNFFHRLKKK